MPSSPIQRAIRTTDLPRIKPTEFGFMMTLFRSTLAALLAISAFGLTHASPAANRPAAPNQPVDVQTVMTQRCASEMTAMKITDATTAQRVCKCTIGVQANNLKVGEFWKIQSMAMNGQNPETLPAFVRIKAQLERCRAGVKLNMPS